LTRGSVAVNLGEMNNRLCWVPKHSGPEMLDVATIGSKGESQ